ncbi:MAG: VOC family protein [Acidobacteriia bacterium]|nr:VOC family protein [Terriglobia bacterium]
MTDTVKAVPQGFHTLTPHLTVRDAERAIDFYQRAFGAEVLVKHYGPGGGKIIHASLKIGDSILMLNDEFPEWGLLSPLSTGGAGVTIHVYLENVDAAFARVVSAGAEVKMPLMDAYWGARYGQVQDPFGHRWSLAARVRNLSEEEVQKAQEAAFASMPKGT